MTTPINNNLHNVSLTRGTSTPGATPGSTASSSKGTGSTAHGHTESMPGATGADAAAHATIGPLAGHSSLFPGAGQNIDWFSDLDAGSKLPITLSDKLQGKSIQEMVDIIMGNLGLRS